MILIVNTTSDTAVTEELKRCLEERSVEVDIVEAASLNISHCIRPENARLRMTTRSY